jgi:DNA-binding protein
MKIYFQFFEDKNLLIHKFVGDWSTQDYENYVKATLTEFNEKNVKCILSDLRAVDLTNAIKDVDNLVRIRDIILKTDYINIHLVTSPTSTAASQIYRIKLKEIGKNYYYCSTLNRVIELIKIEQSEAELEYLLNNLKFEFSPSNSKFNLED